MLSRTADNLYWLARYMERAETAARLLEVGARISLLPTEQGYRNEWDSLLRSTGSADGFAKKYGQAVQRNIESFLFFDRDNPSSVASSITAARENGRIVRTALTTQVWDALNTAFQELRQIERTPRSELELSRLTDWTMKHTAMVRGAIDATLLRGDSVSVSPFDADMANWGLGDAPTFMACIVRADAPPDAVCNEWLAGSAASAGPAAVTATFVPPFVARLTALRYGWPLQDLDCCPQQAYANGFEECPAAACPVKLAGGLLPANPFFANITAAGTCACQLPQVCDA